MRSLLIEKLGGHFNSICNNLKDEYKPFDNGLGQLLRPTSVFNEVIKLNHFFRSYLSKEGVICIISLPKDSLIIRKKNGIDGYSNIVKICCKHNLKNFQIKKSYVNIYFSKEKKDLGGVENFYVIITIKTFDVVIYKCVSDFLDEKNILFLRKFIFQCIKNPNPNIAKYIA